MPLAAPAITAAGANAGAGAPKVPTTNKSPVRINVKVEPFETEKAQRGPATITPIYPDQGTHQVPSTTNPRSQPYDFSAAARAKAPGASSYPKSQQPTQRAFSFEPYAFSPSGPQNGTPFMHPFLQHPQVAQHSSLLAQQQHLQAVHQHLQAQQQLLNGMQGIPLLQNAQHNMQFSMPQQVAGTHDPQSNSSQQAVPENNSFASVQMDEFPYPVFSSTILEELNQFKSIYENRKPSDSEEMLFFGNTTHPNQLVYPAAPGQPAELGQGQPQPQQQPQSQSQSQSQQTDSTHQEPLRIPSGLGSSSLLSHPSLPLLFQMPQLSGLEEDDKWILSLLNIDGHENVPLQQPTGF